MIDTQSDVYRAFIGDEPPRWTTIDGRVLLVHDMETRHIVHARAMLLRRVNRIHRMIGAFDRELYRRNVFAAQHERAASHA